MKKNVLIYTEGEDALRLALEKLFYRYLDGRKPFLMMRGKTDAIKKFNRDDDNQFKYLMIDLDKEGSKKQTDEQEFCYVNSGNVVYMVQQTEAWYISQPEVLKNHYDFDVCEELKKDNTFTHAAELRSPKNKLKEILKKKGKTYKENTDGPALMRKLNLEELKNNFEDVKNLIEILN